MNITELMDAVSAKFKNICSTERAFDPAKIAQDNLRDAIVGMMRLGNYEIKNFCATTLTYSDTPGPDYNVIFHFANNHAQLFELEQSLEYAQTKRYPFLLILDESNPSMEVQNTMRKFGYDAVGTATKMYLEHNSVRYEEDARVTVKQVTNEQMLIEYCNIVDEAYGRQAQSSWHFMRDMNLLDKSSAFQTFIAYQEQEQKLVPVASSMLYLPKNKELPAGHYSWGVVKSHRQQGIMTALVKKAITFANQNGYHASVAQCFAASVSLAKKIGFMECGTLYLYVNSKPA